MQQAGSYVVSQITGPTATWTALLVLLALHLSMNYVAVCAVQMTSLNRQRANIVFSALFDSDSALELPEKPQPLQKTRPTQKEQQWTILTPAEASRRERIFAQDGALSWISSTSRQTLGFCQIGVGLSSFLQASSSTTYQNPKTKSLKPSTNLRELTAIFANEPYMLLFAYTGRWEGRIVLKPECNAESQLKAWGHALLAVRVLSADTASQNEWIMGVISRTLEFLNGGDRFGAYLRGLRERGWDLDVAALETRSGRRVSWGVE